MSRCGAAGAAEWDRRYAETDALWPREPNRTFAEETAGLAPGTALDLGCGEGRNAIWLAERGWRVTGVDFSRVALERAERMAAERGVEAEWIRGDVLATSLAGRAFDLVLCLFLHLRPADRRKLLAAAAEAVAPGGTLLVVGHDLRNLDEGQGGPRDPDVLLTPEAVAAELRPLTVERAERILRPVAAGGPDAVDTVVRATRPAAATAGR